MNFPVILKGTLAILLSLMTTPSCLSAEPIGESSTLSTSSPNFSVARYVTNPCTAFFLSSASSNSPSIFSPLRIAK